ncbi:MAG: PAS domain-containing protein [Candidatus Dadabacteria bacterium]|nr:MAG: PAS domain-containing protein [Candidatus Dadabacteria bacterium]
MSDNTVSLEQLAPRVLTALPVALVVLDPDFAIRAINGRAERVFGGSAVEVVGQRPGDAFHCVNALASDAGCGHSVDCGQCLLRRAGRRALEGETVEQEEFRVRVRTARGTEEERIVLLTAAPLEHEGSRLAVLLLQDVTVLHRLRGLVPICAACKKIRRDDESWEAIEAFIQEHSHAFFSHGLCPECLERLYPDLVAGRENGP